MYDFHVIMYDFHVIMCDFHDIMYDFYIIMCDFHVMTIFDYVKFFIARGSIIALSLSLSLSLGGVQLLRIGLRSSQQQWK